MDYNPFSLADKTILVTGAAGGIGRATSIECAKLGATLILTDLNEEGLTETIGQLAGKGHRHVAADLTRQEVLDELVAGLPMLDGVVNCAGITKPTPVKFISPEKLERIMAVNTYAPIHLTQRLLKQKRLATGASLVFNVSIGGVFMTAPGNAMYGASKNALQAFVRSVALECAPWIRCNSVNPGMVNTGLAGQVYSDADKARDIASYPMKRYGEPRDIALAIVYLLSDASAWMTGQALVIDGGKTLY